MSTLKVNTLKRYTGTTITIGESGDTITITSGATLSGSGASLTALDAGNISAGTLAIARGGTGSTSTTYASLTANVSGTLPVGNGGTNLTSYAVGDILYASGTTTLSKLAKPGTPADEVLTFATGASAPSWVESAGGISWQSVQTSTVTAVAGKGYPVNTTSGEITVNLPAGVVGEQVAVVDYAGTFDTNACTVAANGSEKIEGAIVDFTMDTERQAGVLTYVDATQGWLLTSAAPDPGLAPVPYTATYLVIAGGGGGGKYKAGGGGAGGYLTSTATINPGTVYSATVGAGGAGSTSGAAPGASGSASSLAGTGLSTITTVGGGGGATDISNLGGAGVSGGSGGGGSRGEAGGSGTSLQGNAGGSSSAVAPYSAGGGGGAGAVGASASGSATASGAGGNGLSSSITGSAVTRAGGGGGIGYTPVGATPGAGGTGGGTDGDSGVNATANTGSGGGGTNDEGVAPRDGSNGGSGVVILSVPTVSYSGTTSGTPTVTTSGTDTIIQFNGDGTYTG